jgi:hypothetical protein
MYLVATIADRGRWLTLVRSVQTAPNAQAGHRLIERALSRAAAGDLVSPVEVEAIRGRIAALADVPVQPSLERDDVLAALGIFLIVVASTFPVVLPRRDPGCRDGIERVAGDRTGDAVLWRMRSVVMLATARGRPAF